MAELDEVEEVLCVEVLVYDDNPSEMLSGVCDVDSLDDKYINVWLDDESIRQFPNSHVKTCSDA